MRVIHAIGRLGLALAVGGLLAAWWTAAPAEPLMIAVPGGPPDEAARADSGPDDAAVACEPAIAVAAAAHDVPVDVLMAIGMVESGMAPWVLNADGTPHFFDTKAEAVAKLEALRAEGTESVDVGCMQINQRWHPEAFATADEAFDPAKNADYSAMFLRSLYGLSGSWTDAVAYYHSSAQRYQRPYLCAVAARLEEMGSAISLECLPVDELDLPVVADSAPPSSGGGTPPALAGPRHMVRIAPASGSVPSVVRGQDVAPATAPLVAPAAGPASGPRVVRVR